MTEIDDRIREPLRSSLTRDEGKAYYVIIRLRPDQPNSEDVRKRVQKLVQEAQGARHLDGEAGLGLYNPATDPNQPYVFAHLQGYSILDLMQRDGAPGSGDIEYVAIDRAAFDPDNLVKTTISEPLLSQVLDSPHQRFHIIIDVNLDFAGSRTEARHRIARLVHIVSGGTAKPSFAGTGTHPYTFTRLTGDQVQRLAWLDGVLAIRRLTRRKRANEKDSSRPVSRSLDEPISESTEVQEYRDPRETRPDRVIYRIWKDEQVHALINRSVATVKADAAQVSFSAKGAGIVWAVIDSGISREHRHFTNTLNPPRPIVHKDFTQEPAASGEETLTDEYGHGTHVAGIIAGRLVRTADESPQVLTKSRDEFGAIMYATEPIDAISGMAPDCKLVSYKVLDADGKGQVSSIIKALEEIQVINDYGRRLRIHGVNLSIGHSFDPKWFACGQSPLCVEVDRLVRSGVVVVIAAGNTGYGYKDVLNSEAVTSGMPLTINDPGNTESAITVGSTHRDMPHIYGVSYFSSKGPTGDGRPKPDLVAPGERIISCAAGAMKRKAIAASKIALNPCSYIEDSGTSMAAPHVSGVIAAFLSVRREFVGRPEAVKKIFLSTATDLNRDRSFQGQGLVDLMRAIQSV